MKKSTKLRLINSILLYLVFYNTNLLPMDHEDSQAALATAGARDRSGRVDILSSAVFPNAGRVRIGSRPSTASASSVELVMTPTDSRGLDDDTRSVTSTGSRSGSKRRGRRRRGRRRSGSGGIGTPAAHQTVVGMPPVPRTPRRLDRAPSFHIPAPVVSRTEGEGIAAPGDAASSADLLVEYTRQNSECLKEMARQTREMTSQTHLLQKRLAATERSACIAKGVAAFTALLSVAVNAGPYIMNLYNQDQESGSGAGNSTVF